MLLPGCSPVDARSRAEDLLADVRAHSFSVDGTPAGLTVGVSVGIAHAPSDADDLRSLYAAADTALYEAKRAGRGRMAMASDLPASEPDA